MSSVFVKVLTHIYVLSFFTLIALFSHGQEILFDSSQASFSAWPRIYSPELIAKLPNEERERQMEFLDTARIIVQDTAVFIHEFSQQPPEINSRRMSTALNMRDKIAANRGYVNLVLADAISRAVYVGLSKQLGSTKEVSATYESMVEKLISYNVEIGQWIELVSEELKISNEDIQHLRQKDPKTVFQKLWVVSKGSGTLEFPADMLHGATDDLVKKRNIGLLLNRYLCTELMMKNLYLAMRYKKQAKDFSLDDDAEKIAKIISPPHPKFRFKMTKAGVTKELLEQDKSELSVAEHVFDLEISFLQIEAFLFSIKSGVIDKQPFLSLSDIIDLQDATSP